MVIVGIAVSFVDLGLSPALVQKEGVDDETVSSLFWSVTVVSALAGLIVFGLAGPAGAFFEEPDLPHLVSMAAVFVVCFGIGQVPLAILQKHLAFDRLSKVDVASGCCGVVTAIASASQGSGAAAPIHGLLVSGAVRLVGLLIGVRGLWRPSFRLRIADVQPFLAFGGFQTGERLVNYLAANLDFVIIGRYLGTAALGPYYVAYQVVVQPMLRLNPILTRVAFPLFSLSQNDDAAISSGYIRIERLIAFVSIPLLVGMAVVAPSFFPVYLGDGWSDTVISDVVILAQILVPVSILKCLGNPMGSAFMAKGRPDIGFSLNAMRLVLNALLFWWAVQSDLKAVALVYVGSSIVSFWAGHVGLKMIVPVTLGSVVRVIMPALFMASAMGIVVALAQIGLSGIDVDPIHQLVFLVSLGGTVYFLLAWNLEKSLLLDIRRWVLERQDDSA
jgi:O-antigen/teichoic acid export membrane protein